MWNFSNDVYLNEELDLGLSDGVYISVCNEIEKNLEWTFLGTEVDGHEKHMAFNGESDGEQWIVSFYYESEAIGIRKWKNNEFEEEEIFEYYLNKNICEILNMPYFNSDSNSTEETGVNTSENSNYERTLSRINDRKKTKSSKKNEISDSMVNAKMKSNKKLKSISITKLKVIKSSAYHLQIV